MPSYITNPLSVQITNLADVYSRVPTNPAARAEILRNARKGIRPVEEPIDLPDVLALVVGFQEYQKWWKNVVAEPIRLGWGRRKCRLLPQKEVSRGIKGISGSDLYYREAGSPKEQAAYVAMDSDNYPFISVTKGITDISEATFGFQIVYEDGSTPFSVAVLSSEVLSGNASYVHLGTSPQGSSDMGVKFGFTDQGSLAASNLTVVLKIKFQAYEQPGSHEWPPIITRGEHTFVLHNLGTYIGTLATP